MVENADGFFSFKICTTISTRNHRFWKNSLAGLPLKSTFTQFERLENRFRWFLKDSCEDEGCCDSNVASVVEGGHVSDANGEDIP